VADIHLVIALADDRAVQHNHAADRIGPRLAPWAWREPIAGSFKRRSLSRPSYYGSYQNAARAFLKKRAADAGTSLFLQDIAARRQCRISRMCKRRKGHSLWPPTN
jgi:hypothetical protein